MSATLSETPHALMSGTESAPNSHASSFDGSLASQNSTREPSSTEVNQQSKATSSQDINTPPTTTSNFSSQESQAQKLRGSPYRPSAFPPRADSGARLCPLSVDVNGAQKPHGYLASLGTSGNIPNKRLANGEIKHGEKSRSSSPPNPERYGHSRGTSLNSKDGPIGDLSNQFHTRLSRPTVKVQNSWESRNIDEIGRRSQQGSPIYNMPRLQHLDDGSQPNHRPEKAKLTTAAHHASLKPDLAHTTTQNRGRPSPEARTPQSSSPSYSPRSALGSRTYESFWREHSMNAPSKPLQAPMKSSPGPSLAPPADILPRSRAETGTPDNSHFFATRSPRLDSPISNRDGSPATPGNKQRSSMRTASQNAAMEKDAVETLLFMSSPGNSGHHPPPGRRLDNTATTPLPEQQRNLPRPTKQVGFADVNGGGSSSRYGIINPNPDQSPVTPVQPYLCERGLLKPGQRLTGADVDRYLDEMVDDSSSSSTDDNDDFSSYATQPHSRQHQHQHHQHQHQHQHHQHQQHQHQHHQHHQHHQQHHQHQHQHQHPHQQHQQHQQHQHYHHQPPQSYFDR